MNSFSTTRQKKTTNHCFPKTSLFSSSFAATNWLANWTGSLEATSWRRGVASFVGGAAVVVTAGVTVTFLWGVLPAKDKGLFFPRAVPPLSVSLSPLVALLSLETLTEATISSLLSGWSRESFWTTFPLASNLNVNKWTSVLTQWSEQRRIFSAIVPPKYVRQYNVSKAARISWASGRRRKWDILEKTSGCTWERKV